MVYTVKDLARLRWKKRAMRQGIHSTFKDSFKIPRAARFRMPNHDENSPPKYVYRISDGEANIWNYYDKARKADLQLGRVRSCSATILAVLLRTKYVQLHPGK